MTVSLVLRLVERALASGRLAGEALHVESGEKAEIRNADELIAFARRERDEERMTTRTEEDGR